VTFCLRLLGFVFTSRGFTSGYLLRPERALIFRFNNQGLLCR
jgi:hypothetical protein